MYIACDLCILVYCDGLNCFKVCDLYIRKNREKRRWIICVCVCVLYFNYDVGLAKDMDFKWCGL
jgi:hypothetical protein